jgi:preprotein translocase subunit SecF
MFVAGILALLGYSINNTIVIFDRIKENMSRGISSDIEVVANSSILQTLGRSFNSSLTTLFTLFVLALFVGSAIQNFVIVLIIGVQQVYLQLHSYLPRYWYPGKKRTGILYLKIQVINCNC